MEVEKSARPRITQATVLACLVVAFLAYVGNYHFVHGSGIALRKIHKVSWSLSETFINADEVSATPPLLLRIKYPLFVQAKVQDSND
jgi:hypothetical protein